MRKHGTNLKRIKIAVIRFFINVATSGKYTADEKKSGLSDYLIRYVLMNMIFITGFLLLAGFIIWDCVIGTRAAYIDAVICLVMALMSVTAFILGRSKLPQMAVSMLLMISYGLMCAALVWNNSAGGVNFVFVYIYPPLTIMLLGMRPGIIISSILLAVVSVEVLVPGISKYSMETSIRYMAAYFIIFYIIVVIESTRRIKDRQIEEQNRRLLELRKEAEAANVSKSNFLANMSHEIRTPMNAIVGMSELLLRAKLGDDERGYVNDIKQAGNNLISIINDILDFSKIEAGKLEIIPGRYLLSSLVNDVVSIIRIRLTDRPIRFYTNIDAYLPNGLLGDEARLRQILLNLLSNAAKYTERGCISMSIVGMKSPETSGEKQDGELILLKVVISDTGIGIKPEDQQKLFGDFVQVNTKRNQAIEGTGLGLAITKRLCVAMGGSISVESEYGKGSVFTAIIPQGIDSRAPFAAVEDAEKKKVLIYEGRLNYARSVCWSLENMRVPHTMVTDLEALTEALFREEWYFVFSGYGLYDRIKPLMDRDASAFPGKKKPPLALMVEWGTEAFIPGVRFVALPAQSLSIANVLNGRPDRGYMEASGGLTRTRFIIPEAAILIVDDIATNLKVAEGLLAPYQAAVDTCLSGPEAIELVKRKSYDIVFMDHMMPGMDGIEAAALIRAWEAERSSPPVPIIALTANAVLGMKEMFLSRGFNDFLSKPIDVSKLDEALARWVPRSKQKKSDISTPLKPPKEEAGAAQDLKIPGMDVERGITMTGGTLAGYRRVLSMFRKDAEERIAALRRFASQSEKHDLSPLISQAHALKSVLGSLGAAEASAKAAQLEAAGKAGNLAAIEEGLPGFIEQLAALVEGVEKAGLNGKNEGEKTSPDHANSAARKPANRGDEFSWPAVKPLFDALVSALETQKAAEIDRIIDGLSRQPLDSKARETLDAVSDNVLIAEYGRALETVKAFTRVMAGTGGV
jgi:signal transduction histidine kinase/CheY-like chemotaxis protein/HPt (histidine-containing phosphotransfer) domain-containing protein